MDWKLEVAFLGVTDVDRTRDFYVEKVGFVLDHDIPLGDGTRFVQLTPPGSHCSIVFGVGVTETPASGRELMVVVPDIERAQRELRERGLEVGEIDEQPWGRFVYFSDPDGNSWSVQELPAPQTS